MRGRFKLFAAIIALLCLRATCWSEPPRHGEAFSVKVGKTVKVVYEKERAVTNEVIGKLVSLDANEIRILSGGQLIAIEREDVRKVYKQRRRVIEGLAVGAGIAFGIGYALGGERTDTSALLVASGCALYTVPPALIAGYSMAAWKLVYQSPSTRPQTTRRMP